MNSNEPYNIKIVVIGDKSVGKTSILRSYIIDKLPNKCVPFEYEYTESIQTVFEGKIVNLCLQDTQEQRFEYNRLKVLAYTGADIILIVFSVVEQTSYDSVYNKWYPLLSSHFEMDFPKIIVGNKIDIRDNTSSEHTKFETLFSKNNIANYLECSALTQKGISQIFEVAIKNAIHYKYNLQSESQNNKDQPLLQQQEKCCCSLF